MLLVVVSPMTCTGQISCFDRADRAHREPRVHFRWDQYTAVPYNAGAEELWFWSAPLLPLLEISLPFLDLSLIFHCLSLAFR